MDNPTNEAERAAEPVEPVRPEEIAGPLNVFRQHGASLIVFFILILLSTTVFSWYYTRKYIHHQANLKFQNEVEETKLLIKERIDVYIHTLYGAQGLFYASQTVESDEWALYIQTQALGERFPGITALEFIERIPRKDKDTFGFKIYPDTDREEYYALKFIEPRAGNEAQIGYDLGSDTVRLAALKEAADSGRATATRRLSLTRGVAEQPGFLICLPVYREDAPLATVEERRAALTGFVAAVFVADDLLAGIFGKKSVHPEIGFQVYDGQSLAQESLLYDDESVLRTIYPNFHPRFSGTATVDIAGRTWTLVFRALPDFGLTPTEEKLPLLVLVGGIVFSLLLFGILYSFVTSRSQALSIAEGMTAKFRESELRYADLIEGAPDPIIILDRLGHVRSINPAAERVSGYPARELVGRYFAGAGALTPSSLPKALQEFAFSVVGKERSPFEVEIIKRNGGHLTMEANPRPIKRDGKTVAVQVIFRDVTERKRAEKVLEESRNYLDKIINSAADPIFVKDRKHRWVLVNDAYCFFLGHKREEMIGKTEHDFFSKEEADVFAEKDESVFESGKEDLNEEKFTDAHGVTHIIRTRRTLYEDAKNEKFIVAIIRDFTGQKLAEEKIRQLNDDLNRRNQELININKELEAFSYSVSHDLRAPLRAINGFANALLEDYAGRLDAEGHRYLDLIRTNAKNMGQLIDDLLAFSRLGRKEIQMTNIDMGELAHDVFRELKLIFPGRSIHLDIQPLYPARGDMAMMRQVVVNLLSNAIKFTSKKEEARIEVGSAVQGSDAVYFVKDNGVGFDMKYAGKLFGVFQRLHSVEEFEGTGVGLAIVQRIVHRHGGRVWAEGKMGEGAAFYFALPLTLEGGKI